MCVIEDNVGPFYVFPQFEAPGLKIGKFNHLQERVDQPEKLKRQITALDEQVRSLHAWQKVCAKVTIHVTTLYAQSLAQQRSVFRYQLVTMMFPACQLSFQESKAVFQVVSALLPCLGLLDPEQPFWLKVLRDGVQKWFPAANGKLLSASACMFVNTPDHDFILDNHPLHQQVGVPPCDARLHVCRPARCL